MITSAKGSTLYSFIAVERGNIVLATPGMEYTLSQSRYALGCCLDEFFKDMRYAWRESEYDLIDSPYENAAYDHLIEKTRGSIGSFFRIVKRQGIYRLEIKAAHGNGASDEPAGRGVEFLVKPLTSPERRRFGDIVRTGSVDRILEGYPEITTISELHADCLRKMEGTRPIKCSVI